jgi:hypothetical protein
VEPAVKLVPVRVRLKPLLPAGMLLTLKSEIAGAA